MIGTAPTLSEGGLLESGNDTDSRPLAKVPVYWLPLTELQGLAMTYARGLILNYYNAVFKTQTATASPKKSGIYT